MAETMGSDKKTCDAIRVTTPLTREAALALRAGDAVLISGTIYTARDAAHARLVELLDADKADRGDNADHGDSANRADRDARTGRAADAVCATEPTARFPFPIRDAILYYVGPTPAKPGQVIGSAGPTTSYRMDAYAPRLIELGLRGMIGKGRRSAQVVECMKRCGAVYFGAVGGAAALLSKHITASRVVCYEDLGAEAIHELRVEDFPATVVIDALGGDLYDIGVQNYLDFAAAHALAAPPPGALPAL
ncbi:MAG: fumarate hydratase C-terminal domain-containing protein [Clostridiales bacterium]|nr:fumarate hydratase C-terminal domain-containing protein [Clostridiales bacterium]